MTYDASEKDEKEREGEPRQADPNPLGRGLSKVRHIDEAMDGFDDMQANAAKRP